MQAIDESMSFVAKLVRQDAENARAAGRWLDEHYTQRACAERNAAQRSNDSPDSRCTSRGRLSWLARLQYAVDDLLVDADLINGADVSAPIAWRLVVISWLVFDRDAAESTLQLSRFQKHGWHDDTCFAEHLTIAPGCKDHGRWQELLSHAIRNLMPTPSADVDELPRLEPETLQLIEEWNAQHRQEMLADAQRNDLYERLAPPTSETWRAMCFHQRMLCAQMIHNDIETRSQMLAEAIPDPGQRAAEMFRLMADYSRAIAPYIVMVKSYLTRMAHEYPQHADAAVRLSGGSRLRFGSLAEYQASRDAWERVKELILTIFGDPPPDGWFRAAKSNDLEFIWADGWTPIAAHAGGVADEPPEWSAWMNKKDLCEILACDERKVESVHEDLVQKQSRQRFRFRLDRVDAPRVKLYEQFIKTPKIPKKPRGKRADSRKLPQTPAN